MTEVLHSHDEQDKHVHPIAYDELAPTTGTEGPQLVGNANPLHKLKARVTVRVGGAELTVGELMALREQQLLPLDRQLDALVDVMVEGSVIAQGELVAVDDRFAVRITRLPVPLKG